MQDGGVVLGAPLCIWLYYIVLKNEKPEIYILYIFIFTIKKKPSVKLQSHNL